MLRAHDLMDFVLSDEENGLWFGPRAAPGCTVIYIKHPQLKTGFKNICLSLLKLIGIILPFTLLCLVGMWENFDTNI